MPSIEPGTSEDTLSRRAVIIRDDIDSYDPGCDCGKCNPQGKSFGAAIFTLSPQK